MQPIVDEPEMERIIDRLVPAEEQQSWRAAAPEDIEELERISQGGLPPFYTWFLQRMGSEWPHPQFQYERQDFRIETVLDLYRRGVVQPDSRYLLIGRTPDSLMTELVFYDRLSAARDDAMVVARPEDGWGWRSKSETLRERMAHDMLQNHRISKSDQWCTGSLDCESEDVLPLLDAAMSRLGFIKPISTGSYCGLYERENAAWASMAPVDDDTRGLQFFQLGGPEAGTLRQILGEIANETPIEGEIDEWHPPLR